jgi:hypothetical protein
MAEFKLGRIRFIWKNNWAAAVTYVKDDIVRNGGKTYLCVIGHTADANFYTDLNNLPTRWNQVSDGSEWKDNWTTGFYYKVNDLVKYGGRIYLCNTAHTSNASASSGTSPETTAGLEADQSKWDLYASNFNFRNNWATTQFYKIGDVVRYGGISYVCNTSHTSSSTASTDIDGLEADQSKWDTYAKGLDWIGNWTTGYRYKRNDVVLYGGTTYVCNTGHASAATATLGLENDQGLWDYFHKGITFLGTWSGSTVRYKVNDVVKYGADLWICTLDHTSAALFSDATNWSLFVGGLEYENSWSSSEVYQPGDVVSYGGYAYISKTNHTNKIPTSNLTDWDLFTTGFSFQGDWATATDYKVGQVLRLNGFTYVALLDHTSSALNIPPDLTNWSRLNSGIKWAATGQTFSGVVGSNVIGSGTGASFNITLINTRYTAAVNTVGSGYVTGNTVTILGTQVGGISPANDLILTITATAGAVDSATTSGSSVSWKTGVSYVLGDAVAFGVSSYICILAHTGGTPNRPDNDVTGTYWNLLSAGAITSVLTTQGDTLYMGGAGPTRLPIGTDGQVLRVNGTTPQWSYFGVVNNIVYVALTGTDALGAGQGLTIDKPWKTVRFAAKQIEDGYLNPNAALLLTKNKQFIVKELSNYVTYTSRVTITSSNATLFTTSTSTSVLSVGMPISFTTTVGGVTPGTTYYVFDIPAGGTTFGITNTSGGTRRTLSVETGANVGAYVFSTVPTERDAGIIVDALAFDISHSGTLQTTTAALAYFAPGGATFAAGNIPGEIPQFIRALDYLKNTLVVNILTNTSPVDNYQTLNSVSASAQTKQIVDPTIPAEIGTSTTATNLVSIITTGLASGTTSAIPAVINPGTTISVKTGTYSETLPIIVPKNTAVVGDELRSSVIQPATANMTLVTDKPKTISVLNRIKAIVPNLVTNTAVTPTSGNTVAQVYLGYAGTTATSSVSANLTTISDIVNNGLGVVPAFTLPDPTSYDTGYFNARRLIVANKAFLISEVSAWINAQIAGSIAPFVGFTYGGAQQTSCERDVGYIVDAVRYDITYGGNLETLVAGRSYYSFGVFVETGEKDQALAVQARIKDIIDNIATGNTAGWTKTTGLTQDVSGTPGSAGAAAFAQARIQDIYTTINTGTPPAELTPSITWVSTLLQKAAADVQARKASIQASAVAWVQSKYPLLVFNTETCSRDVGYIVDALTYDLMFGSNFRSVKAGMSYYTAQAALVVGAQKAAQLGMLAYMSGIVTDITTGIGSSGIGSSASVASILTNSAIMNDIVQNGLTAVPAFTFTNLTGYNTSFLAGYGDGKAQIVQNYAFIKDEVSSYLNTNFNAVWVALGAGGQANCQRDVGYILDALQYDMTYGGNTQTLIAGSAYYSNATLTIASIEKTATIAAYTWLKGFIDNIVTADTAGWVKNSALSQVVTGTAGSAGAATFAQDRVQSIIDWITNGTAPATILPTAAIALASTPLQNAYNALQLAKTEIQSDAVSWVRKFYQALNFNSDTCYRDAGYIVDAFSYDLMFGTNFNSVTAAMSYYRATTSAQYVLSNQAIAERGAINFIAHKAKKIAAYDTAEQLIVSIDDMILSIAGTTIFTSIATQTFVGGNITIPSTAGMMPGMPITFDTAGVGTLATGRKYWIVAVTNSTTFTITETYGSVVLKTLTADSGNTSFTIGEAVETTGTGTYNNVVTSIKGAEVLRANKAFLSSEATAWVSYTYANTIVSTDNTNNRAITGTNHNFVVGDPVVFSATTFGNIVAGTVYYILAVPTTNTFTLTVTQGSAVEFTLATASGTPFAVTYSFSPTMCKKDMAYYVDALVYDLTLLGNYKSMRAVTLYKNAVSGSLLSDMFLLRNGTGLRNMTLSGLTGTLTAANSYGTSRVTAGAYSSLDPGYGPNDKNVWITPKSPYTQNVTMFGTGCIGMKIDGALHSAGNRSIVANDYTTILSDGIGVWCTGSQALTELVSVFAYYSYAGYLAELGGKMRATNGNNSYGIYGSLAEGVDTYEVPITATVNNRYYQAQIGAVLTDSTERIYRVEFTNAGTEYNSATFSISGTGYGVTTVANEFRDNAVFESRVLSNGANYVTQTNVAQAGNTTNIVIAATDAGITGAYIGMRVIVTGGSGVGQIGYFTTYNNGTKAGIVAKESFTPLSISAAGSSLLTVSSTSSLYANMPVILTGALLTGMSTIAIGTIYYVIGSTITSTQFSVASSSGGTTPVAVGTSSSSSGLILNAVGWDHIITGTPIASALDLTSSYIIEPRITFTSPTYTASASTSISAAWADCVYSSTIVTYNGLANAGVTATGGSGTGATFTIERTGTAYVVTTNVAISGQGGTLYKVGDILTIPGTSVGGVSTTNNITIKVTLVATVPVGATLIGAILNFTYAGVGSGGAYVAIASTGTTTQYSTNGTTWTAGGALSASATWTAMASGGGRWVAIAQGNNINAFTTDPTVAWTAGGTGTALGNFSWSAITYGNGVFMAVASGSAAAAYSTTGVSWTATGALPASTTWSGVTYGNGVYVAVASGGTQAASSADGLSWTTRALPTTATWSSVTFGKGVFVAVASGSRISAYSRDGINWIQSAAGLPVSQAWSAVRYGQGLFFAVAGTGSTTDAATSEDGANWTSRTLAGAAAAWPAVAFGNPSSVPLWVALTTSTTAANSIVAGCTTQGRVKVSANSISEIRLTEPGSGYSTTPSITITDPNQTSTATWSTRIGVGALANPTFTNRGFQYATALATVTGNGYADKFQEGYYVNVAGLTSSPVPGSNVVFTGDSTFYKLVAVNNYLGTGGGQSPYTARFQISPQFTAVTAPAHNTVTTMRIKYSQVRLTVHDFLSIGTGGTTTTNYPGIPTQPADVTKQTVGNGGGRVFYTSTDQDGNFTVGTLFSVQQATGVASINADAFNLAGLNSLTLGSVALGGTGATITSFSTDQYFSANSDNIVPTQKAIKSYISSQIGGGSSALNVNTLTAGVIYIAGNSISTTTGVQINVTATMNFTGGINGLPLAMDFLLLG